MPKHHLPVVGLCLSLARIFYSKNPTPPGAANATSLGSVGQYSTMCCMREQTWAPQKAEMADCEGKRSLSPKKTSLIQSVFRTKTDEEGASSVQLIFVPALRCRVLYSQGNPNTRERQRR